MKLAFFLMVLVLVGATTPGLSKAPAQKDVAKVIKTETVKDMVGLRILSIEAKSFLDQLGLKRNDVLTAINGQPIEDLDDIVQFFQERKAKQVNLELLRDGRPETFTYDLK